MKLTYFNLESHLNNTLLAAYVVSGDELLLKQEVFQLIRKKAKGAGFTERVRKHSDSNGFDWDELYALLHATSLFGNHQIIELDLRNNLPNKSGSQILKDYAENPLPNQLLLIEVAKVDDKISKSAWYKAIEKNGATLALWPIAREKLPQWIRERAKKYQITFNTDAANLLAEYAEGNLIAAAQTIEKIYLMNTQKPVDVNLIQTLMTHESRFTPFDLVDKVIAGNRAKALHVLQQLRAEGSEPVLILWGLTRELRLLLDLFRELQSGTPVYSLFQKYRVFAHKQAGINQFLTQRTAKDCWQYLNQALQVDRILKGAQPGNSWDALESYCLSIML